MPTEEAEAALLAKGLLKAMPEADEKADKAKSKKDFDADVAEIESKVNDLIKRRYVALSRAAVVANITATSEQSSQALLTPELLRAFVRSEIDLGIAQDALKDSTLAAIEDTDDLTDAQVCQAIALIMTFGRGECQQTYAVEHGIDTRAITKQAIEQIKAEVAAQIAALKAAQKPPPPKSPLAQPSATPPAEAKPKTPKPKAKPKLNAEQAQLGIAQAMQGIQAPPTDGAGAVSPAAIQFNKGRTGGVADFKADELEAA